MAAGLRSCTGRPGRSRNSWRDCAAGRMAERAVVRGFGGNGRAVRLLDSPLPRAAKGGVALSERSSTLSGMEDSHPRFFRPYSSRRISAQSLDSVVEERLWLVDSPYGYSDSGCTDDGWQVWKPPHGMEGYWNRQVFLHSYPFTREQSIPERLKHSFRKFKSFVWALMACNYKPVLSRKIKQKFRLTTRYLSCHDSYRVHLPECLRISA